MCLPALAAAGGAGLAGAGGDVVRLIMGKADWLDLFQPEPLGNTPVSLTHLHSKPTLVMVAWTYNILTIP